MKEERTHVLDMLKNGKISVDEAVLLLEALGETAVNDLQLPNLTGDHIVQMGMEGVAEAFIEQIKGADFLQELDGDAFVQMAIEGVDNELLQETMQLL
ncbi:MAG: hypothetical protein DHS20C20_28180 [Ardenticatenaceae bacterium]|nr:MAG: hypothetical protein DHS20C20_28180 [Ardenticatenaceae bacterium]